MTTNRNPIKQWECTFPQTDMSREDYIASFPPLVGYICAREEHKDGGFHLHAGLKLKKAISFAKLKAWVVAKFPEEHKRIHISAIKNWSNWEEYCLKEDPACIQVVAASTKHRKLQHFITFEDELERFRARDREPAWSGYERMKAFREKQCKGCEEQCGECEHLWKTYFDNL